VQSESLSWSGSKFQTAGPATENARRPSVLRRWRGTVSKQQQSICTALCMYNTESYQPARLLNRSQCIIILQYSVWQSRKTKKNV